MTENYIKMTTMNTLIGFIYKNKQSNIMNLTYVYNSDAYYLKE